MMDKDMDAMENAITDVLNRVGSSGAKDPAFKKADKDLMNGLEAMKKYLKKQDMYSGF